MSSGPANTDEGVSRQSNEPPGLGDQRPAAASENYVILTGNPNCGKTTIFNALTGLRAKVGNYAGVTVERKEGRLMGSPPEMGIKVLDLPGTYSLSPQSLDEQVSRDVLLHRLPQLPAPALIVIVVDASNLQRNLYYATQVIELGYPTLIALNMIDVAESNGHQIDIQALAKSLGTAVIPLVASSGNGIPEMRDRILSCLRSKPPKTTPRQFADLPASFSKETADIASQLAITFHEHRTQATAEALLILSNEKAIASSLEHYPAHILQAVEAARQRLDAAQIDWRGVPIEARYTSVAKIYQEVVTETQLDQESFSDKLDAILTHKVWGTLIFLGIMALMFQSIFSFARIPMDAIQAGVDWFGGWVGRSIPAGDLNSLLVGGIIAGVGAVIVFLPQILLLFLFIGLLEDTGYMARAAFLMDRLMSKVGLHGKSFIPMLSSFACAIPGIMATRTIESPKDRLVTILVAPLMSCSARLPVYTLLIAACIPNKRFLGFLRLPGLTMLSMYLLGIVVALLMAWLFKKTLLKGETPMLIMELPPYKRPLARVVLRHMWDRSRLFLRRAGTVILGINILLWFLATYPRSAELNQKYDLQRQAILAAVSKSPTDSNAATEKLAELEKEESGAKLRYSFAGRMGQFIEPAIAPLGFDWKIGIGIVASFAAREVFVSTMSTVYNLGKAESSESITPSLAQTLTKQTRADGKPIYTPLTAVALMVFYVFALQCVSTVAVVRRETNSWKWPAFQWLYMGALAWLLAFITYQGGRLLGWE
ncbi:ferrous iron transport protein B [Pedosphaera parvula]|uniref:Ferrous iron transport protein B n=1 Tax=Pedosphaera parvula (strain Ellin514) TaxID=320771 RepID=B9XMT8_PEDPL|nr:ferrous iron transport protein B [Pedosphaera parvula]EEF58863.1 ferrous iron transport protein B [Pedosphaera parvula Ellin514]